MTSPLLHQGPFPAVCSHFFQVSAHIFFGIPGFFFLFSGKWAGPLMRLEKHISSLGSPSLTHTQPPPARPPRRFFVHFLFFSPLYMKDRTPPPLQVSSPPFEIAKAEISALQSVLTAAMTTTSPLFPLMVCDSNVPSPAEIELIPSEFDFDYPALGGWVAARASLSLPNGLPRVFDYLPS